MDSKTACEHEPRSLEFVNKSAEQEESYDCEREAERHEHADSLEFVNKTENAEQHRYDPNKSNQEVHGRNNPTFMNGRHMRYNHIPSTGRHERLEPPPLQEQQRRHDLTPTKGRQGRYELTPRREQNGRYDLAASSPSQSPPCFTDQSIVTLQPVQSQGIILHSPEKEMVVDACVWLMTAFISIWFFLFTGCVAFILSIYMVRLATTRRHAEARKLMSPVKLLTVVSFLIGVLAGVITLFVFLGITISETHYHD